MSNNVSKAVALSLFAGIGGFEIGMAPSGFSFIKTLEWDEKCCITLNQNRNYTDAIEENILPLDITKTEPSDFFTGQVDYIVGGPPCQSFSAAGRRAGGVAGTSDTRGTLFWYYCQYVNHFKPKAFVFENVRGILSSKKGEDFKIICASFEEVGYNLFWRVLNAADFGVPQQRERVFLVGIRKDLNIEFHFPRPTHGPDSPEKKEYVTVRKAIADLDDPSEIVPPYGGKYGHLLPDIPPGENYRYYTEEMGHPEPLFAWRSKFSNFLYKMNPDDICRTIIAYQGSYDGPFHWKNRKCTVDELKRMQGFPKDYIIPHNYTEGVKQIGNSVCPPVAYQIGKALRYQIEGIKEMKVPLIENGETLSFDKRKGVRARQSRAKKTTRYSDLIQANIFEPDSPPTEYPSDKRSRVSKDKKINWVFENGELLIEILNNGRRSGLKTELDLQFFGGVTSTIKRIIAKSYVPKGSDPLLNMLWDEMHSAVSEFTFYDSLLPLYGHFTEPYPKFMVKFDTELKSPIIDFQAFALGTDSRAKILEYSTYPNAGERVEDFLRAMREYGYDVRTHSTNRTIPEHHFRICYPFTMPTSLKSNIVWIAK